MPLSELWRLAGGKFESDQQRPCPTDISSPSIENDLVELVWENGQITMQSQSGRGTGSLALNALPLNTSRSRDDPSGRSTVARIGKFGGDESMLDDMSSVVPSGELDLGQDDEMVPWLNYPIGDVLPQDYVSDLLPAISGVTAARNSVVSVDKGRGCNVHNGGNTWQASSSKARPVCSNALGSGVSNVTSINNTNSHPGGMFGSTAQGKATANNLASMEMERPPNIGLPTSNNSNVLNFPYFSRPATLVKANISNSQGWAASRSNPFKSTFVDCSNSTQKDRDFHVSSSKIAIVVSGKSKESFAPESTKSLTKEHAIKNDKSTIPSNTANPTKGAVDGDRYDEPMVVSSSVGSGNSADRISCEQTHNSKRKFHDLEDSECRSDDVETVSIGVTKTTPARGGNGSKRSRAAEVHNFSERRRRDRINEKMRALQQLIPNCNKVDKASMLDEAIEYLKTLQLQVQIMSMGAGLCVPPPMMFHPGMHPAHVPQFSPMGMGMGMPDACRGSPSCPIFPVPPVHFPSVNFQRFPAPNIGPVYGHLSQGRHSSIPRAPLVPVTGQLPTTSALDLHDLRSRSHSEGNSVDAMTDKNSQLMFNAEASGLANPKSAELQATNEVIGQSATAQKDKQATDATAPSSLTSN